MEVEIILALLAYILAVFGAFKNAESKEAKNIARGITIIGLAFFIFSCINTSAKVRKSKANSIQIDSLINSLQIRNDSILKLNHSLQIAIIEFDTLKNAYKQLKEKINRTKYAFYTKRIEIDDGKSLTLDGKLFEGMEIRVLESNCDHSVAIIHNQKRVLIKEDQSGKWSTTINENTGKNKILFSNEGNAPCGMIIEIFSSKNSKKEQEEEIHFIVKNVDNRHIDPPTIECIFNEFDINGSWQMRMDYSDCIDNSSSIEWSQLTTYFSIDKFYLDNGAYNIIGNKFAENYKGKHLDYSREFPLISNNGYLEDCKIIIPITAEYGENQKSDGFIKLLDAEIIQNEIIIYGEFKTSTYKCRGDVILVNN